ncbi:putative esterase [Nakamurella sp. UYEF19]|uniref:alpha/beta hydrolase n=1 Tax=Nakamurella sp. UYEF19 TaxID=1756392 RepID=UPI003398B6B1
MVAEPPSSPAAGPVLNWRWGFSQGAWVLSHHLLIRQPEVASAFLFTGGYIGAETPLLPTCSGLSDLPVLVRSIENDPFVPPERVRETAQLLTSQGAEVDLAIDRVTST